MYEIDEEILIGTLLDCESIIHRKQAGRPYSRPKEAAVTYWSKTQTLRRFLTAPKDPQESKTG